MAHSSQGIYSPLPQSISDSDSEKELHMDVVCPNYSKKNIQNGNSFDLKRKFPNNSTNLVHLGDDLLQIKRGSPRMSTVRKVAFFASIILCLLPIVVFLWFLPCSVSHTCPIKTNNWENKQEDIELKGDINLVHGINQNNLNMAILFEGDVRSSKILKNGAISFLGNSGSVAWYFWQEVVPIRLDCSLIDIDGNGVNDCLLLDERGLKAIETISGQVIWHVHSHEERTTISGLDFPVKLPDYNNDAVNELAAIYRRGSLMLICGKTGKALNNIIIKNCNQILDLEHKDNDIVFSCFNDGGTAIPMKVPLVDIKRRYSNTSYNLVPHQFEEDTGDIENTFIIENRKLTINNMGICPNCRATIELVEINSKKKQTWPYDNASIMTPKLFHFQATKSNLHLFKGHINGFILKIWQWSDANLADNKLLRHSKSFKRSVFFKK
jgi:hypothetical protein